LKEVIADSRQAEQLLEQLVFRGDARGKQFFPVGRKWLKRLKNDTHPTLQFRP
jgi:hypothetical protein